MKAKYENFLQEADESIEYWSQVAILDFTEELCRLMKEQGVKRSELADRIGSSPAYVTKILRGNANFTLATMTKLAHALEAVVRVHLSPEGVIVRWEHEHADHVTNVEGENHDYNVVRRPFQSMPDLPPIEEAAAG